jgi:hypothetical protein
MSQGVPEAVGQDRPLHDPRSLQILTAEHTSLLSSRLLAYNEAFSRATMFLTFLSASLIVIGFLLGAQGLRSDGPTIVAILLAADLFVGLATFGRLIDASNEELRCVRGMNRIRHAYREMVPGLAPYFVSGFHDDARGVLAVYTHTRSGAVAALAIGLTTTTGMIGVIDGLVAGALSGVVGLGLGASLGFAVLLAVVGFVAMFGLIAAYGSVVAARRQLEAESLFPSPEAATR